MIVDFILDLPYWTARLFIPECIWEDWLCDCELKKASWIVRYFIKHRWPLSCRWDEYDA